MSRKTHIHRLIAIFLLWGMRFGLAWFIAHQYLSVVSDKLNAVTRALGKT